MYQIPLATRICSRWIRPIYVFERMRRSPGASKNPAQILTHPLGGARKRVADPTPRILCLSIHLRFDENSDTTSGFYSMSAKKPVGRRANVIEESMPTSLREFEGASKGNENRRSLQQQ
jgi:hypothetical protein